MELEEVKENGRRNQGVEEDDEEERVDVEGEEEEQMLMLTSEEEQQRQQQWSPAIRFDGPPRRLYHFYQQFRHHNSDADDRNNFLKGVKWSPDGSCFLTSSDDNSLRLFYLLPTSVPKTRMPSAGNLTITMTMPAIYIIKLRCTYCAYDAMDEITAARSVSFNSSGAKIFAGYNKFLRVFDVHRPGQDFGQYLLLKGNDGPSGIVSSIAFSPTHSGMLAIGSYSRTTAVYSENNMELIHVLRGQGGGVTQVLFSKDGNYIYSGGRKDPYILCWDVRNTAGILYKLYCSSEDTNQQISFDIEPCGRHLGTGGQDGMIHIYDLQTGRWTAGFQAASDTVNGVSFHPTMPLAAASSGTRRFSIPDSFEENMSLTGDENCASIWAFS